MKDFEMKYNKEFRDAYPETVGETDHAFDTSNYSEFLECMLEDALNNAPKNAIHNSEHVKKSLVEAGYGEKYEMFYICDNCGCYNIIECFKFCPDCGVKI